MPRRNGKIEERVENGYGTIYGRTNALASHCSCEQSAPQFHFPALWILGVYFHVCIPSHPTRIRVRSLFTRLFVQKKHHRELFPFHSIPSILFSLLLPPPNQLHNMSACILDCDPGIDDTLAILHCMGSDKVDLKAITLCYGCGLGPSGFSLLSPHQVSRPRELTYFCLLTHVETQILTMLPRTYSLFCTFLAKKSARNASALCRALLPKD